MRDGGQGRHGDKSKRVVVRVVMEVRMGDKGQQMDEGQGRAGDKGWVKDGR